MPRAIDLKHRLYSRVGRLAKALGQETRLEIIEILAQCPRTVETLSQILKTDIKSVSAHLKVLHAAGLVRVRRQGRFRQYAVAGREVLLLAVLLRKTAEHLLPAADAGGKAAAAAGEEARGSDGEADRLGPNAGADALDAARAVELAKNNALVLIDVRPPEEFAAAHLPGAVNMPLETLEAHIDEISEHTPCAAYCRGAYCFLAQKAREVFKRRGRNLSIVREGVLEFLTDDKEGLLERPAGDSSPTKPDVESRGF